MAFGFNQISNPTPTGINLLVRLITIVTSVFIAWMNTSTLIPESAQDVINSIAGLIIGLINGVGPLFGVEVAPTESVPAKDVSAMKTK